MDDLQTIINTLDEKEHVEFQHFIQRNRHRKQRKDLKLFKLLSSGVGKPSPADVGVNNANAYHALRRRLYRHLSDFILLRATEEDMSSVSRVNGIVSIARHLFEAGSGKVAWKMLKRAEQLASKNDLFEALSTIYLLQAEYFEHAPIGSVGKIMDQYELNKEKLMLSEQIAMTQSMIKEGLRNFKREGKDLDLARVLNESLAVFELQDQLHGSPKLLFNMLETMRGSVVASKDFHSFGPIVEEAFASLKVKDDHFHNVLILYMIAHSNYRNKQFDRSQEFLDRMELELLHCSRTFQRRMLHKCQQLRAGNLLFLRQVERSIEILKELLNDTYLDERSANNAKLNLVVYHFLDQGTDAAKKALLALSRSDNWYKQKMGVEFLLKRDLLELLLFHELNEPDLVASRLRSIQRKYAALFKQKTYQRVKTFLRLIKEYTENETYIDLKALEEKVEMSWEWLPKEEEDLQAMMFFAWFQSKLSKRGLYESMLALVVG